MSALLGALAIPCGHEALFNPERIASGASAVWPEEVRGESSWLATPFLDSLPADTLVLHQVRDPVAVVRSFLRTRFFEGRHAYKRFAESAAPELASGTPFERCVLYWLHWNRRAERGRSLSHLEYRRHRLEEIDAPFLSSLCAALGEPRTVHEVAAAFASVPRDTNTSGNKYADGAVRWSTLPRGTWSAELEEQARRYGYGHELADGALAAAPAIRPPAPALPARTDACAPELRSGSWEPRPGAGPSRS